MRFVLYVKGERGHKILRGLEQRKLLPCLCVSEGEDRTVTEWCSQHSVPLIVEKTPKSANHIARVHESKPELLVCGGYSKILPAALFEGLAYGAINCHGGKLPEYRGASPIPWQLINGETAGAAYVLKMTAGIDDGPVLAEVAYAIGDSDTARDLTDKVTTIFENLVPDVVKAFAEGKPPAGKPQSEANACHWTRRVPEDGKIDWSRVTVREAVNLVRGLDDPYPGAFLVRNGERVRIRRAVAHARKMAGVPGRVVGKTVAGFLLLATDGAVEILEVEAVGARVAGSLFPVAYGETF